LTHPSPSGQTLSLFAETEVKANSDAVINTAIVKIRKPVRIFFISSSLSFVCKVLLYPVL
jgi:hypothetical protein